MLQRRTSGASAGKKPKYSISTDDDDGADESEDDIPITVRQKKSTATPAKKQKVTLML